MSDQLRKCPICQHNIAQSAKKCPSCGKKFGMGCLQKGMLILIVLIILLIILIRPAYQPPVFGVTNGSHGK